MKVVILGPAHPLRGGMAAFNERMAHEFLEQGDEVTIYSFSLQYPSILFPGKTQFTDSPPPGNINILKRVNSINPINWVVVGNEIKKNAPDVLVVKYWLPFMAPCLGTICRIVKGNRKTKIVCNADNIVPHEKRPGDSLLTKYFIKSVDAFVVMSDTVLQQLNLFDKKKPRVLTPHPIYDHFGNVIGREEALTHLGLNMETNYLLFFGFIRDYKGLDILLKAMCNDDVRKLGVKLIVAGEFYNNSSQILDFIAENNLSENVILHTNFIPDSEVKYYFCAADLVVQPYKNATQSGVTQICYHFNKPMLVTNVGGLAEMVTNKVGYITEVDVNAISSSILDFYTMKRQSFFSENIKLEKSKFSWSAFIKSIKQVYSQLL